MGPIRPSSNGSWEKKTFFAHVEMVLIFFLLFQNQSSAENKDYMLTPRDSGSPKLRMVSWNLNTMRFGGDWTP